MLTESTEVDAGRSPDIAAQMHVVGELAAAIVDAYKIMFERFAAKLSEVMTPL